MKKKAICLLLAFSMLCVEGVMPVFADEIETVSVNDVSSETANEETVWNFAELSVANNINNKSGTLADTSEIKGSTTFVSLDGMYEINASVNAGTCTITSFGYTSNVKGAQSVKLPERINLWYVSDVEKNVNEIENEDGTKTEVNIVTEKSFHADKDALTGENDYTITGDGQSFNIKCSECTVTGISDAFGASCHIGYDLSLELPSTVTTLDSNAFAGNDKLESVSSSTIRTIGVSAFDGCTNLTNVQIGKSLQSLGKFAFRNCSSLQTLDLTGGESQSGTNTISTIPEGCFYKCTNLKDIKITNLLVNVDKQAFYQCNMGNFDFEATNIQVIGAEAFSGCTNLVKVILPKSVTSVSETAFKSCLNLKYVYCPNEGAVSAKDTTLIKGSTKPTFTLPSATLAPTGSSVDGMKLYADTVIDIKSTVDVSSVSVTKDGNEVSDGIASKVFDDKYQTDGFTFSIPKGEYGVYEITATSRVGETGKCSFTYVSDIVDNTPPVITLTGKGGEKQIYQSVTITAVDNETEIASIMLDGEEIESGYTVTKEGWHQLVVLDSQNNVASKAFTIDKTAPAVEGVTDGLITKKTVQINFSDANGVASATLNGEKIKNGYIVTKSGEYELIVKDWAENETCLEFVYDADGVSPVGIENNAYYNSDVSVNAKSVCGILKITDSINGNTNVVPAGSKISSEGEHTVVFTDVLGTTTTIKFTIDKTAPIIEGLTESATYYTKAYYTVIDDNLSSVKLNGITQSGKSGNINKDGKYTLTAVDKAGNKTSVNFTYIADIEGVSFKGLENKGIYNKDVVVDAVSVSGIASITDTIDGNVTYLKNGDTISKEGSHTLKATNNAGDSFSIRFTIDKTAPVIEGIQNGKQYNDKVKYSVSDTNMDTVTLNGESVRESNTISDTGKYVLKAVDKAGNISTVSFTIDSRPVISGIKNKAIVNKNVTIKVSDTDGIKEFTVNGKDMGKATKTAIKKDGKYKVSVTDKKGNETKISFTVDKTKPTTNVKAKAVYKKGKKVIFKDKTSGIKTATLNGQKIKSGRKIKKKGSYTLKLTDKAGNKTTVKFKIR